MCPKNSQVDLLRGYIRPEVRYYAIGIGATWLLACLGPLSLLLLLFVPLFLVDALVRRRWMIAGIYLLSLPTTPVVVGAIRDYRNGSATTQGVGHLGPRFYNQDRDLRCGHTTGGCLVSGNEWLTTLSYNLTLTALIHNFGYMPGSYDGPYPSEEESLVALETATRVTVDDMRNGQLKVGGRHIAFDSTLGREWIAEYEQLAADVDRFDWEFHRPIPPITASIFQERCLVSSIPGRDEERDKLARSIILVDTISGRPFALYSEGRPSYRPWIQWRAK